MSNLIKPEPILFAIFFRPHRFKGSSEPKGFHYCMRIVDDATKAEVIARGQTPCMWHGIVFGDRTNIGLELPEPYSSWAAEGSLPYLPSAREIAHLGQCHLPERKPLDRMERFKFMLRRKFKSAPERRIHEARLRARLAAHEKHGMKGLSHV